MSDNINHTFPQEIFNKYLNEEGLINEEGITKNNIDSLFRKLADGFRKETLSLDDFSTICSYLYTYFSNLNDKDWLSDKYSSIKNILEIASELNYHVRHPSNTLLEYLEDVITYPDYKKLT